MKSVHGPVPARRLGGLGVACARTYGSLFKVTEGVFHSQAMEQTIRWVNMLAGRTSIVIAHRLSTSSPRI